MSDDEQLFQEANLTTGGRRQPSITVHRRTGHRILVAILLLLGACFFALAPTIRAQSYPPLTGVVADDTGNLNAAQVNDAAKALQALNVKPLAVFLKNGSNSSTFANQVAGNYGLANTLIGTVDPDLFAIVATL